MAPYDADTLRALDAFSWLGLQGVYMHRHSFSIAFAQAQVACGLRGAIAFGLAMQLPHLEGSTREGISAIESATLVIVVLSTLIFGGATGWRLKFIAVSRSL